MNWTPRPLSLLSVGNSMSGFTASLSTCVADLFLSYSALIACVMLLCLSRVFLPQPFVIGSPQVPHHAGVIHLSSLWTMLPLLASLSLYLDLFSILHGRSCHKHHWFYLCAVFPLLLFCPLCWWMLAVASHTLSVQIHHRLLGCILNRSWLAPHHSSAF